MIIVIAALIFFIDNDRCSAALNELCGRPPQYAPAPCKLNVDVWPWKWCRVTCDGLPLC